MKNTNATITYQLHSMFLVYQLNKRDLKKNPSGLFQTIHNISLSLLSLTPWCFFFFPFTMEARLFKRRMNAEMTLYCRQVISRFDLRCSALLPLSLCRLLQWADPLVRVDSEGWLAEGQRSPSWPVQACLFRLLLRPPLQFLCLLLCFLRLAVCISETAEASTGLFEK